MAVVHNPTHLEQLLGMEESEFDSENVESVEDAVCSVLDRFQSRFKHESESLEYSTYSSRSCSPPAAGYMRFADFPIGLEFPVAGTLCRLDKFRTKYRTVP